MTEFKVAKTISKMVSLLSLGLEKHGPQKTAGNLANFITKLEYLRISCLLIT